MSKQSERTLMVSCPSCGAQAGQLCTVGDMKTHISCYDRKKKGRELQKESSRRRRD